MNNLVHTLIDIVTTNRKAEIRKSPYLREWAKVQLCSRADRNGMLAKILYTIARKCI